MEKKKVLFVITRLTLGGAQKSMISALNNFNFDKYDITLYVRENKITELLFDIDKHVKIIINDKQKKYDRKFVPLLYEFLKKLGFRSFGKKITDYVIKKRTKNEKKNFFNKNDDYDIVVSYINGYTSKFVIDVVNAEKRILFYLGSTDSFPEVHKEYLPRYDYIITDSYGTATFLASKYPVIRKKIRVIENYIDYGEIVKKADEDIFRKPSELTFCTCGRMSKVKGFDIAVRVAKILKEKEIIFKWVFVGDGPERLNIEKMISDYDLKEYIIIVGSRINPYPYIKNCDIYVQPSYEESFGLTITEAMMLRRVVVSTDTVGAREQINDGVNGILSLITPESMADELVSLIYDKKMYNSILDEVCRKDYSSNKIKFKEKWNNLLEEL